MTAKTQLWFCLFCFGFSAAAPAKSPRLIATTPSATELVYQLGKGGDLVAASQMSDYPPAAKQLPHIGAMFMPSIERVLRFSPDWVILDAAVPNPLFESGITPAQIHKLTLKIFSVDDLFASAGDFLQTIYQQPLPKAVVRYRKCLDELKSNPKSPRYTFLAFAWMSPAFLFGQASFLSDVIRQTGGENALPAAWKSPYPQISEEWILAHPVDTVFYLSNFPDEEKRAKAKLAEWWPGRDVHLVMLSWAHFARTSFAPFEAMDEIVQNQATAEFKRCREQLP